jgi:predicted DNA-binding protein
MKAIKEQAEKSVRLELSSDHHKLLRVIAAKSGKPMSQWVRELVEKEIERRAEK